MSASFKAQRLVHFVGALLVVFSLVYVPFYGSRIHNSSQDRVFLGYAPIWSPPNVAQVCVQVFGMNLGLGQTAQAIRIQALKTCAVAPSTKDIWINSLMAVIATLMVSVLVSVTAPRSRRYPHDQAGSVADSTLGHSFAQTVRAAAKRLRIGVQGPRVADELEAAGDKVDDLLSALSDAEGPDGSFVARDGDADRIRNAMQRLAGA